MMIDFSFVVKEKEIQNSMYTELLRRLCQMCTYLYVLGRCLLLRSLQRESYSRLITDDGILFDRLLVSMPYRSTLYLSFSENYLY